MSCLSIVPPILKRGFPPNHEGDSYILRTIIYSQHFKQFDFIPVWSSADNFGYGSPLPSLYHKLFWYVSGSLFALTNSLKFSIGGALIIFASIGSFGIFLLARELKIDRWLAQFAAISFVFSNYAITNWLVRGALSEYSAMMLVPWFMYFILNDLRRARFSIRSGVCLGLIFLAHSLLAYFIALIVFTSLVVMCLLRVCRRQMFSIIGLSRVALGFSIMAGFWLLPMLEFRSTYDLSRLTPEFLQVKFQFHSIRDYFWDRNWSWFTSPELFTVQLDIPVLVMSLIFIAGFSYGPARTAMTRFLKSPGAALILLVVAISMALQYQRSALIYDLIPGANFIQFPWRLLSFISLGLIVLAFALLGSLSDLLKQATVRAVGFLLVLAVVAISGTWQRVNYYEYPDRIDMQNARFIDNFSLSLFGEYLPVAASHLAPDPKSSALYLDWYRELDEYVQQYNQDAQCSVSRLGKITESTRTHFSVDCATARLVALPIFASPAHRVAVIDNTTDRRTTHRCITGEFIQGLCAVEAPAGVSRIEVINPTWLSTVRELLLGLF